MCSRISVGVLHWIRFGRWVFYYCVLVWCSTTVHWWLTSSRTPCQYTSTPLVKCTAVLERQLFPYRAHYLVCWWGVLLLCTGVMFYYCVLVRCSTTGVLVYQQSPLVRYTGVLVRAAVRLQSPLSGSKSARLPSHCLISPTTVPYQNRENLNVKINKVKIVQTNGPHFWTQYEALILNSFLDIGKITRNDLHWERWWLSLMWCPSRTASTSMYVQLYFLHCT